uniref:Secreted protein n=1 Tax=Engystomops pustulosus TaxID=76066 RepID=A0AAV6YMZ0_ENGPU|nr:hypothetical protein GDO81_026022 [Engystomops pustulosus]
MCLWFRGLPCRMGAALGSFIVMSMTTRCSPYLPTFFSYRSQCLIQSLLSPRPCRDTSPAPASGTPTSLTVVKTWGSVSLCGFCHHLLLEVTVTILSRHQTPQISDQGH